mmetsp:Transcript_141119/g.316437  ORF Transcript_141119/g.316437 Transcript_141119/m.316437 type:complete len:238 (+) Transcript_141119:358-1071(+)
MVSAGFHRPRWSWHSRTWGTSSPASAAAPATPTRSPLPPSPRTSSTAGWPSTPSTTPPTTPPSPGTCPRPPGRPSRPSPGDSARASTWTRPRGRGAGRSARPAAPGRAATARGTWGPRRGCRRCACRRWSAGACVWRLRAAWGLICMYPCPAASLTWAPALRWRFQRTSATTTSRPLPLGASSRAHPPWIWATLGATSSGSGTCSSPRGGHSRPASATATSCRTPGGGSCARWWGIT